jgi:hypothetical protein
LVMKMVRMSLQSRRLPPLNHSTIQTFTYELPNEYGL